MKVIAIGGYPGSGKSTIVQMMLERLAGQGHNFILMKHGKLVPYMESQSGLIVLGTYSKGQQFPGTDRMAMNAQPEVMEFLLGLREQQPEDGSLNEPVVLFEGDRLFNAKMFNWLQANHFNLKIYIVQTHWAKLEARRNERSKQSETWRKGRQTKVDKISISYPISLLLNNTLNEQRQSVETLIDEIIGNVPSQPAKSGIKSIWS